MPSTEGSNTLAPTYSTAGLPDQDAPDRQTEEVSEHFQNKVVEDAVLIAAPRNVASANVGKDVNETFDQSRAATANAESADSPLLTGPLLRYTHQSEDFSKWHGSALVVLNRKASPVMWLGGGEGAVEPKGTRVDAVLIYERSSKAASPGFFYRFDMMIPHEAEARDVHYRIEIDGAHDIERTVGIAAKGEAFRILFHSCNGFCDGANEILAGPALWADVLRRHKEQRFHVMIGGGDQIYSDGVQMKGAPLEQWASLKTGHHRAGIAFTAELEKKMDQWYFTNHADWYNTSPFREASSLLPSVNIWDDHDIIDGFGSYKDRWQKAPVFSGIGEIAWRYMNLFQQHLNPDTPSAPGNVELENEPAYIRHPQVGPYIKHQGISIMSSFGPEVAFVGFDCRTDRTQRIVCNADSYDAIFSRMEKEVVSGKTKHLLVLLGVPIAYPRLVWLETAMQSPHLVTPLRWIHKMTGALGGVFNDFDGAVELLDDLQDHWAVGLHKKERNALVLRLQEFARHKGVRITILSGDVHLGAVGRFFSKKSLKVPQEKDFRYMVNIISSAITNAPPPAAVAMLLHKRNKLHHLDRSTDENLMRMWNVSASDNSSRINETTYPARNYCIIQMQEEGAQPLVPGGEDAAAKSVRAKKVRGTAVDEALTQRSYVSNISHGEGVPGSLSISLQVEVDGKSDSGETKTYAFSIPALST